MASKDIELRLVRRLVDGVAAWAAYRQAALPGRHIDERMFYNVIREIAEGHYWKVKQEAQLVRTPGARGSAEKIDFVIFRKAGVKSRHAGLIFIEVKYFRGTKPNQDIGYLHEDIEKLSRVAPAGLECGPSIADCGEPSKFLFIVGRVGEFNVTANYNARKHPEVAEMLRKARDKKQPTIYKKTAATHLKADLCWSAYAIGSTRWPQ